MQAEYTPRISSAKTKEPSSCFTCKAQLVIGGRRNPLANWGYNGFVNHLDANGLQPDRVRRRALLSAVLVT